MNKFHKSLFFTFSHIPTAHVFPLVLNANLPKASEILKGSMQILCWTSILTFAHLPPGMHFGFSFLSFLFTMLEGPPPKGLILIFSFDPTLLWLFILYNFVIQHCITSPCKYNSYVLPGIMGGCKPDIVSKVALNLRHFDGRGGPFDNIIPSLKHISSPLLLDLQHKERKIRWIG